MTLRSRLFVIGAIRGADGRQQVLRLGSCAGAGANALPRSWNGSPPSQFQLWRSSLPTKKSAALALETALSATLSNHPYFQPPN